MDTKKIDRMTIDGGRRAEVHTTEQSTNDSTQRITEHFEEIVPLEKKKQITETIVPVVMERTTEEYENGKANKVVERVADLSLRLSPQLNQPVTAEQLETIVRKVIDESSSNFKWFGNNNKIQAPTPAVVTPTNTAVTPINIITPTNITNFDWIHNPILNYVLLAVLASIGTFIAWCVFLK